MTRKIGASVDVQASSLDHPKCKLLDTVRSHCFSHQLEILLPNEDSFTQDLNARLQAIPVGNFCVLQCRLQAFLEPNILDSLISPANEFRALSLQRSLDGGETIAVTASAQLHLHVSEATHQKLGLVGERSKENGDLFHVHVDLTSKNFQSKGQYFQRVCQCLEHCSGNFDFICSADRALNSDAISFCQLVSNAYRADSKQTSYPPLEKLQHPSKAKADKIRSADQAELQYALDSIGALSLGVQPEACIELISGSVESHVWTGLVLPTQVEACLSAAADSVDNGKSPWAALTVRGFRHAPVIWETRKKSQTPSSSSGADYIVLLLPGKRYFCFVLNDASNAF